MQWVELLRVGKSRVMVLNRSDISLCGVFTVSFLRAVNTEAIYFASLLLSAIKSQVP